MKMLPIPLIGILLCLFNLTFCTKRKVHDRIGIDLNHPPTNEQTNEGSTSPIIENLSSSHEQEKDPNKRFRFHQLDEHGNPKPYVKRPADSQRHRTYRQIERERRKTILSQPGLSPEKQALMAKIEEEKEKKRNYNQTYYNKAKFAIETGSATALEKARWNRWQRNKAFRAVSAENQEYYKNHLDRDRERYHQKKKVSKSE